MIRAGVMRLSIPEWLIHGIMYCTHTDNRTMTSLLGTGEFVELSNIRCQKVVHK